jgi:exodeoxyribonuclease X
MPPHHALPDAYVTAHVLIRLLKERNSADLVQISAEPALLRKIGFGKHKGTLFSEAPADYLQWIVDKADFDADVTWTAKFWLQRAQG